MRVRGIVLPEREERTFWIRGDRLTTDRPPAGTDAESVVDGGPGNRNLRRDPASPYPTAEEEDADRTPRLPDAANSPVPARTYGNGPR